MADAKRSPMTRSAPSVVHRRIRPTGRRLLVVLAAAPPVVLATAALTGVGLERGLSGFAALLAALALGVLPPIGLTSGRTWGSPARSVACWAWSGAILLALPAYFPGERVRATERGLRAIAGFAGEPVAAAVGGLGASVVRVLGDDPPPTGRIAAAPGPGREAGRAPRPPPPAPTASRALVVTEPPATVLLPYEGDQTSLRVRVDVDGPRVGERLQMIFDTGATFTTLDHATLDRLGVRVEPDAPWITLHTANGAIEAPLVLVDAVWLSDAPIEWVTVAVCDTCVSPPAVGLLGLNVTQRFLVSLDHDRRRIELAPRQRAENRALDVRQWLSLRSRATRDWTGTVDVSLTAGNRAHRPIAEAVIDLTCGAQTFAVQIDDIPARGDRETRIELPRGTDCREQHIEVSRATWVLDRF